MEKKVFIFLLGYKHAGTMVSVLNRIPNEIIESCSEILVSDDHPRDGSKRDDTKKLVEDFKKKNSLKKLTYVAHEKNLGYGGNQKFCYNYGIKKGYDLAVMVHGDGQYAPEEISNLLEPFETEKADFVFGSRMTQDPLKGGMPLYKYFGNKFLTTIENFVLKTNLSEFHSGFRLFNLNSLKKIPFNRLSDDYYFDSEIVIQLVLAKMKICERPIPTYYGEEVCYVNSVSYGLSILNMLVNFKRFQKHKSEISRYDKFNF